MAVTKHLRVDETNTGQLEAWDGDEGAYWAAHPDRFDRSIAPYHERLMAVAGIVPGDRVLDLGCGSGQTTRDAARAAVGGSALGVDLSAALLDVARRQSAAEGITNAAFEQVDAQVHEFEPGSFDVAISRTAAMFFGDLDAAFANVARSLRPGGRLAMVTWQPFPHQEWMQAISGALAAGRTMPGPPPDGPGPFSLSDHERVRAVLDRAGFTGIELESVPARMWFGDEADDAHGFVLGLMGWMLEGLDERGRTDAIDALRATMRAHETTEGVVFGSAAWITTATRG